MLGMVESRGGFGLLQEAFLRGVVAGQIRREELDGDVAIEPRVMGLIDDAHPALAELADDAVRTELCTGLEGHEERRFYLSARVRWGDTATQAA